MTTVPWLADPTVCIRPETADLTLHEFAPPCRSSWHEKHGNGPAVWIVWQVKCCHKRPAFGLVCDPCLQAALAYPGACRCPDCGERHQPARRSILRVEPIGGAS